MVRRLLHRSPLRFLFVAVLVAGPILVVAPAPAQAGAADAGSVDVIVRFADPAAMAAPLVDSGAGTNVGPARSRRQELRGEHRAFLQRTASAGIPAVSRGEFGNVFNGLALRLPGADVTALSKLPGVAAVYPDRTVHTRVDSDVSLVDAPAVWSTRKDTGAGVVVAVVDTGVDYTHPDLGGGFGPGHKVVAGYDFVNGDADPMDDNGHGTHVAGIIAGAAATSGGRTGVAPGATLTAYKVLDDSGSGLESTIIAGLERAVDVDNPYRAGVVNLSLGGAGSADDPLSAACEAAEHAGVVVVVAAGNDGPAAGSVGSPGDAADVLTVGASVSGVSVPAFSLVAPISRALHSTRFADSANPPATPAKLSVVDVGLGDESDFAATDVTGKAVLVNYSYRLPDVLALAKGHGAAAVLAYTPNYYQSAGAQFATGAADDGSLGLVAVQINGSDAADIQGLLATGPVSLGLRGADATDQMAEFSSRGPVPGSYALKPEVVAPGVEIRSTVPGGGYERMSGTSMAAPHVAGAAALVRQAHPDWSAATVQAALTSSAHQMPAADADVVGAGRLDALAAVTATVLPSPSVANLGLADLSGATVGGARTVTLTNTGAHAVSLSLSVSGTGATVTPKRVRIPAGGRASVTLRLTAPRPATAEDLTGAVVAQVSGGGTVTVPYLLAVRPLDLHATPDPTVSTSTVLVHAEPSVAGAPVVKVTGPTGVTSTPAVAAEQTGWWRVPAPGGRAGVYLVTATARTASGTRLLGTTTYQVLSSTSQSGRWQSVGPVGDAGPMAVAASRPGRLYVLPSAGRHAGLFRTDDYGKTWHEQRAVPVGDGADVGLAVDPHDADTVYLAVDATNDDPTYHGRILVSHDAGGTWTATAAPDVSLYGLTMNGTVLVANGLTTVYVSNDHGGSWQAIPVPDGSQVQTAQLIGADLYLATDNGLYVVPGTSGTPRLLYQGTDWGPAVMQVAGHGGELAAATLGSLAVSTDAGATWSTVYTPPDGNLVQSVQYVADDLYVTDSHGISVRHAGSWSTLPAPAPDQLSTQVAGWPGRPGTLLVTASGVGVFQTSDHGASYTRIGITGVNASAIAVSRSSSGADLLAVGTDHGSYATALPTGRDVSAATREWGRNGVETSIGDQVEALAVAPSDPRIAYRALYSGHFTWKVDRSNDGGVTWTTVVSARITGGAYQIVVSPADPRRVYVSYRDSMGVGLLVSRDGGGHWSVVSEPDPFTALAADPANPDALWLGGPAGLFRSTDAGQTLTKLQSVPVSALAVEKRHLVVGGTTLWTSLDGGRTLLPAVGDTLRMSVTAVVIAKDGTMYAGTGQSTDAAGLPVNGRGVLRSRDGGRHWENISAGLGNFDVRGLALSPDGRWLFAGTGGGGVYRVPS